MVAVAAPEVEQLSDDLLLLLRTDLGLDQMDDGGEEVLIVDVSLLVPGYPPSNDLLHVPHQLMGNVHLV